MLAPTTQKTSAIWRFRAVGKLMTQDGPATSRAAVRTFGPTAQSLAGVVPNPGSGVQKLWEEHRHRS